MSVPLQGCDETTYASGLPVGRQLLELLGIAELDQNRDCPFFIVVVWRKLQFARTSDA
jgi:hypothetical protein